MGRSSAVYARSREGEQRYLTGLFCGAGKPISCRAGCGICCRQRVPIAEFEAHRLRRLVESMPEPRRSEIIARFYASEVRVREAGADVLYDDSEQMSIEEMTRRAGSYFRLMIPCPFLENESCSIYEERPLKCREYLVTSPAANCADPELLPVVGLPQPLAVYMTTLFLDEESRGPGIRWVPLNQLMSWTDSHSPAAPEKTGPELLQEFMFRPIVLHGDFPDTSLGHWSRRLSPPHCCVKSFFNGALASAVS